jgi:toxin secretion/phage lysis holin
MKYIKLFFEPSWRWIFNSSYTILKSILAIALVALDFLLGNSINLYITIFVLVNLDALTGISRAIKYKNFTSSKFRNTVIKLVGYFIIVVAATKLASVLVIFEWLKFAEIVAAYICSVEFISIVENLKELGIVTPAWIIEKLNRFIKTGKFNENGK